MIKSGVIRPNYYSHVTFYARFKLGFLHPCGKCFSDFSIFFYKNRTFPENNSEKDRTPNYMITRLITLMYIYICHLYTTYLQSTHFMSTIKLSISKYAKILQQLVIYLTGIMLTISRYRHNDSLVDHQSSN